MTNTPINYVWYDLQDPENDYHTGTLQEARQWLVDFWIDNPMFDEDADEDYTEEGHHAEIMSADPDKLDSMMQGVDWTLEDIDKDELELLEIKAIEKENAQ